jgi:hypothetical protein
MADIKLGLTKEAVEAAKETYEGPRLSFPANKLGYTKHTGIVTDLQVKTSADGKKAWLWVQVTNEPYMDSLLVNLDPSDIAPTTVPDKVESAVKRNLDTLLRAIKVLGISNAAGNGIDTDKFASARGTLVSFGAKQGDMQANGYPKLFLMFYGKAESVVPVVDNTSQAHASVASDQDVPF